MPPHALLPMVRRLLDPDEMGATPTHQAEVHKINTTIWGPKDSSAGEILLLVPFRNPNQCTKRSQEGMLRVEGRAIRKSCHQEKWAAHSLGSTALASSPATCGPWSQTMSLNTEDLYPAEHPFIQVLNDSDDWRKPHVQPPLLASLSIKGATAPTRTQSQWDSSEMMEIISSHSLSKSPMATQSRQSMSKPFCTPTQLLWG